MGRPIVHCNPESQVRNQIYQLIVIIIQGLNSLYNFKVQTVSDIISNIILECLPCVI